MHIYEKLLAYYKKHYNVLSNGVEKDNIYLFDAYLRNYCIGHGVCYTAMNLYEVNISGEFWVKLHCLPDNSFWWKTPLAAKTIEEKLECLKMRIDILERVINAYNFYYKVGIILCTFFISLILILLIL